MTTLFQQTTLSLFCSCSLKYCLSDSTPFLTPTSSLVSLSVAFSPSTTLVTSCFSIVLFLWHSMTVSALLSNTINPNPSLSLSLLQISKIASWESARRFWLPLVDYERVSTIDREMSNTTTMFRGRLSRILPSRQHFRPSVRKFSGAAGENGRGAEGGTWQKPKCRSRGLVDCGPQLKPKLFRAGSRLRGGTVSNLQAGPRGYFYIIVYLIGQFRMISKEERLFDMGFFREYIRVKLTKLLDDIPGKKMLMLDTTIQNALAFIDKKLFYDHGVVKEGGVGVFDVGSISANFNQVVIIMPANQRCMETFISLYQANEKKEILYYLVFCPKKSHVCNQYLQAKGLLDKVIIKDFSFGLLPLDHDLYSLEQKSFKQIYLESDQSIFSMVAESIHRLQSIYGRVKNVFGKGAAARSVIDILKIKEQEINIDDKEGDIEHLIIFDRSVDLVTPLLKPFTYEAMIEEVYGIVGGFIKLQSKPDAFQAFPLNTEKDDVFAGVRMLNVSVCMKVMHNKALELDSLKKEADSIKEMKNIERKFQVTEKVIGQKKLLTSHITICGKLIEQMKSISFYKEVSTMQRCLRGDGGKEILQYYENLIPFGVPFEKLMRPYCLYSIVEKGIHKKMFKPLVNEIAQCYGPEAILSISNLSRLGIFNQQNTFLSTFAELRKEYKLISSDPINHQNPADISFAYGGYIPVLVKLVEQIARGGWRTIPKVMKLIPGQVIAPDMVQPCTSSNRPVNIVYFVGGATYGEVAALRLLGKLLGRQMVVCTTEMLTGESMIRSVMEKPQ